MERSLSAKFKKDEVVISQSYNDIEVSPGIVITIITSRWCYELNNYEYETDNGTWDEQYLRKITKLDKVLK